MFHVAHKPTLLVVLYASITIFLLCIKCVYVHIGVTEMPSHATCAACPPRPAMFQLCGGDVFMSDFKRLNIFSKSWI